MGCPGARGGMDSVPRSAVTPNRMWYWNHATRYRICAIAWRGMVATKLLGMRRHEICFRSLVVAVSSQSRACWCHSPQE